MPAKCEICGKMVSFGNRVKRRGKAKYLGGVGRKITGITRRQFRANLQRVRVQLPDGTRQRMRVCTQCMRSGGIVKRVKRIIPQPEAKA